MNKREKNLQRIKQFRLLDDDFMSKVFEDIACIQLLLQIILNRNDLQVNEVRSQYTIKNLQGRSVRLDIFAIDQLGKKYNILYVNFKIKNETELGKLMHDFSCTDPNDMNYDVLAERVRYFKEEKEGVDIMCKIMEDMIIEDRKEMACRMLNNEIFSLEKIAEYTGLSIEEVKKLTDQKTA